MAAKTTKYASKILTREDILSASTLKRELVRVPEWGGSVWVQELTGELRDRYDAYILKESTENPNNLTENFRTRLVALSIVDEGGSPMFTLDDIQLLSHKSSAALARVFKVASRLSNLNLEDVESAKVNFTDTPPGGSTSG